MATTTVGHGPVLITRALMEGSIVSGFRARLLFGTPDQSESGVGITAALPSEVVAAVEARLAEIVPGRPDPVGSRVPERPVTGRPCLLGCDDPILLVGRM